MGPKRGEDMVVDERHVEIAPADLVNRGRIDDEDRSLRRSNVDLRSPRSSTTPMAPPHAVGPCSDELQASRRVIGSRVAPASVKDGVSRLAVWAVM